MTFGVLGQGGGGPGGTPSQRWWVGGGWGGALGGGLTRGGGGSEGRDTLWRQSRSCTNRVRLLRMLWYHQMCPPEKTKLHVLAPDNRLGATPLAPRVETSAVHRHVQCFRVHFRWYAISSIPQVCGKKVGKTQKLFWCPPPLIPHKPAQTEFSA